MFVKQQAERINFKPFGQAIKSTREKKGLTRKELAAQIRISPRYIASIENSGQTPSLQVFYRFVKAGYSCALANLVFMLSRTLERYADVFAESAAE